MKILMTGFAARGIGSTRTKHKIVSLPDVLSRALTALGHDVDGPRRVSLDEALSTDLILMQVGWISSLSSTYAHEAGLLMADAAELGIPVLRYVDDWRSQWLADDIAGHALSDKGWDKHVNRFRAKEYADIDAYDRARIRNAFLGPIAGDPLAVPIMGWGNHNLFDVSTKARLSEVLPFDPQSLCDTVDTVWASDVDRARRWVVASLQDHDKWVASQNLSWEVLRLGGTKKNPGGTPIKGAKNCVIPEGEVLQKYAESWGVLSPEYDSAGSGYWRTRYDQTMSAGALLWPGAKDAEAIGGPFLESAPLQVEGLRASLLGELQGAQAAHLDRAKVPYEGALEQVSSLLSHVNHL